MLTSALCPDEEGIKTLLAQRCRYSTILQLSALTKKGLRLEEDLGLDICETSALCPDEEGIKTRFRGPGNHFCDPSALCPDEEGIKTLDDVPGRVAVSDFSSLP